MQQLQLNCISVSFSLLPLMNGESVPGYQNISYTQYPRPSVLPQKDSDQPKQDRILYMGYATKSTDKVTKRVESYAAFITKTNSPFTT